MREVKKTGHSREAHIRALIDGYVPKPLPPPDYYAMMRQLHAIGNNLNQLAVKVHAAFQEEADRLRRAVQQVQQAVTEPERRPPANPNLYPP